LTISVVLAGTTLGLVGTAYGLNSKQSAHAQETVTGSGSAGSGSLAVAMFYSFQASNGAGAFSGTLHANLGYETGLFSLTFSNPANAPLLPCPAGQVSFGGTVASGSFQGANVLVAICIGSGVPGTFLVQYKDGEDAFSGQGTGAATLTSSSLRGGVVAAGVTTGSGTAGSGTLYTAEADALTRDGTPITGGAFVGTVSDQPSGNIWNDLRAIVQPGCTLTTSGTTATFGSYPHQPVTSSYTSLTCPPSSTGPQTARFVYVIGGDASPLYKGTGSSIIRLLSITD